ncbi:hypothetical protein KI387_002959, partial [Taxus chinensis]
VERSLDDVVPTVSVEDRDHVQATERHAAWLKMLCFVFVVLRGICIRLYIGDGGNALRFDKEESTLYLPVIKISENTETVVRNLMAME